MSHSADLSISSTLLGSTPLSMEAGKVSWSDLALVHWSHCTKPSSRNRRVVAMCSKMPASAATFMDKRRNMLYKEPGGEGGHKRIMIAFANSRAPNFIAPVS